MKKALQRAIAVSQHLGYPSCYTCKRAMQARTGVLATSRCASHASMSTRLGTSKRRAERPAVMSWGVSSAKTAPQDFAVEVHKFELSRGDVLSRHDSME